MASGKAKHFTSKDRSKANKRSLSDVSNSNDSSDEFTMLMAELEEIKKKTVTKDDLKSIVTSIVSEMLKDAKKVMEKQFEDFKKQQEEARGKLIDRVDNLYLENESLKEAIAEKNKVIRELKSDVKLSLKLAKKAEEKSNTNEQYSRKSNIKI